MTPPMMAPVARKMSSRMVFLLGVWMSGAVCLRGALAARLASLPIRAPAGRSVEQAGDEGDGAAGDGEGDGDGGCGHADGGGTDAQGARGGAADEGAGAGGHGGATCADLGAAGDDLGQFVAGQADGDGFGDGHGVLSFLCGVMGSLPKRWMQCAGGGGREWVWQACQCGGGDAAERLPADGYWLLATRE